MRSVHWLHFKSVCYARDITGAIYPVCNYYVQILQLLKRPSHNYTRTGRRVEHVEVPFIVITFR